MDAKKNTRKHFVTFRLVSVDGYRDGTLMRIESRQLRRRMMSDFISTPNGRVAFELFELNLDDLDEDGHVLIDGRVVSCHNVLPSELVMDSNRVLPSRRELEDMVEGYLAATRDQMDPSPLVREFATELARLSEAEWRERIHTYLREVAEESQ